MNMENILKEIAEKEGFGSKAEVKILGSGLEDGSNFHGSLVRGRIAEDGRALSVVIKREIPCSELNSSQKFTNEIHFYTRIHPSLKAYGEVPRVPRILWSGTDKGGAILAMEDLSVEGYKMPPVDRLLDPNQVQLALKELGKLHETSKKMKELDPLLFDELTVKLEEGFCVGRLYEGVLDQCYKNAISAAAIYLPPNYKKRLELFDYAKARTWVLKRAGVITHGDSWSSNFMFKYEGETPISIAIVDWQMCRVGSPLLDISELLLTSTSGDGCPSAEECKFGLTMALTILPFALGQSDARLVMTPEKLVFPDNPLATKRVADVVKAAVDSGII